MAKRDSVLLTGATGFLGQYLLRDLLVAGRPVAVLVRDTADGTAEKRAADLVGYWSEILGRSLPAPRVLAGELGPDGPGLTAADRRWLAGACGAVVHAAASLAFRDSADGEPWRTNVGGTEALLALCRDAGVTQWHQVSTAFVCGRRCGPIAEDDALHEGPFHNPYEASKCEAERLLRRATGLRVSVYRPSLIVGDSRTGHTSNFNGLYRFLELATRLAAAHGGARLPVRLPMTGAEPWDLVPVDWVSRAIVELMARPRWHGHTFHLTGRSPVTSRVVRDVAAEVLRLEGVEFAGPGGVRQPDRLE